LREWERAASYVLSSIFDANAMVEVLEETIASHKVRLDCYGQTTSTSTTKTKTPSSSSLPNFLEAFFLGGFEAFFGTIALVICYVLVVESIALFRRRRTTRRRSNDNNHYYGRGDDGGGRKFD